MSCSSEDGSSVRPSLLDSQVRMRCEACGSMNLSRLHKNSTPRQAAPYESKRRAIEYSYRCECGWEFSYKVYDYESGRLHQA